jgi:NAD(P)-dependent dehydrogenase (short-subunit alcohol dehydrogenase family)
MNVLVTGASSGIGAATARAVAARGDTVGICARREDRLTEVLEALPGGKAWVVDLADLDGIDAFAARADDELGGIDVLVNNAGIPKRRRTTTMTPDDAESVMAMNYFSPVRLTLALMPRMIERGRGDIVNVSSMGVHLVAFGVGAYSASKAALELFTESLYVELPGTGVRAHLVVPGTTVTEFSTPREGNDPPLPPGPTAAKPEDVAAAIVAAVTDPDVGDQFVSYATAQDADTSATKAADPNAFLAQMREALAPLRGG